MRQRYLCGVCVRVDSTSLVVVALFAPLSEGAHSNPLMLRCRHTNTRTRTHKRRHRIYSTTALPLTPLLCAIASPGQPIRDLQDARAAAEVLSSPTSTARVAFAGVRGSGVLRMRNWQPKFFFGDGGSSSNSSRSSSRSQHTEQLRRLARNLVEQHERAREDEHPEYGDTAAMHAFLSGMQVCVCVSACVCVFCLSACVTKRLRCLQESIAA
jgi:hypothetical protein